MVVTCHVVYQQVMPRCFTSIANVWLVYDSLPIPTLFLSRIPFAVTCMYNVSEHVKMTTKQKTNDAALIDISALHACTMWRWRIVSPHFMAGGHIS